MPTGALTGKKILVRVISARQAFEYWLVTFRKHDLAICTPLALPDRDDVAVEVEVSIPNSYNLRGHVLGSIAEVWNLVANCTHQKDRGDHESAQLGADALDEAACNTLASHAKEEEIFWLSPIEAHKRKRHERNRLEPKRSTP